MTCSGAPRATSSSPSSATRPPRGDLQHQVRGGVQLRGGAKEHGASLRRTHGPTDLSRRRRRSPPHPSLSVSPPLPSAPPSQVRWSPHARFLIIAGFGNLSGELSFWDRKTCKCLGTVDAHMSVNYEWSPDSKYFLTAILFPRLRVDNGYRIWSCNGNLLHSRAHASPLTALRPPPLTAYVSRLTDHCSPSPQATSFTRRRSRSCRWRSGGRSPPTASPRRPTPTSRRKWRR